MEIRPLGTADDRNELSHVYEESWKAAYKNIIPAACLQNIPKGRWAAFPDGKEMHTLVMTEHGKIIGTSSYSRSRRPDMEDFGEIVSVYLLPAYAGRGYGKQLLKAAVDHLEAMGFKKIFLWVLEKNENARRFYEKCGFQCAGIFLDDVIGGKKLREIQYRYYAEQNPCAERTK